MSDIPQVRRGTVNRATTETQIALTRGIDGQGSYTVSTGIRFFDRMLQLFTRHRGFDLKLKCSGDLDVDQHHTVEDVGIALGEAFLEALGDKKGILRAGYRREGECACEDDVWALESPQDRGDLQGVCAGDAWGVLAG